MGSSSVAAPGSQRMSGHGFRDQIDWYENTDWAWITAPASASGSFSANINVPADTPYGMYSGAIVLDKGSESMVVPVEVAVVASPNRTGRNDHRDG